MFRVCPGKRPVRVSSSFHPKVEIQRREETNDDNYGDMVFDCAHFHYP